MTHDNLLKTKLNQRGFSLLEMLAVLAIMAVLIDYSLRDTEELAVKAVAQEVVDDVNRIQRASMRFYRAFDAWPMDANTLVTNGYLTSGEEVDGWGNVYLVDVSGNDLTVTVDVQEPRYVSLVRGKLPRVTVASTTITSFIDRPGEEAAHDALYARDGSRNLTGTMDANNQDILNANQISANRVFSRDNAEYYVEPSSTSVLNNLEVDSIQLVTNVSAGGTCTSKQLGTSSNGTFYSCVNGLWTVPGGSELPIGSIYITVDNQTPDVTLGYGTWTQFGWGRTLVGRNNSNPNYNTTLMTGGSETQFLTEDELPAHQHIQGFRTEASQTGSYNPYGVYRHSTANDQLDHISNHGWHSPYTSPTGNGESFSIMQPYIVVAMWRRTG